MKIQIIGYDKTYDNSLLRNDITISEFAEPKSLDAFDLNIINLNDEFIWRNKSTSYSKINIDSDLYNLNTMILHSFKTNFLFLFPQNYDFLYTFSGGKYVNSQQLKNIINVVKEYLFNTFDACKFFGLVYEMNKTSIMNKEFKSDFYFINIPDEITKSVDSDKATTIKIGDCYFTTIDKLLSDYDNLLNYLKAINLYKREIIYPEWIIDYNFYNDNEQNELIQVNEDRIKCAKEEIVKSELQLKENLKYKSILYNNGDELVDCVFDILQEILQCDLSNFSDEKKEDFLIMKEDITFIGEIKGVTSNVKSEHVSQVEVHYQGYLDQLQEKNIKENVKQLLIINPFRTKPLLERDCVHETQIELAKRNNCLIIETKVLLFLFEKYKLSEITYEEVKTMFTKKTGLLEL